MKRTSIAGIVCIALFMVACNYSNRNTGEAAGQVTAAIIFPKGEKIGNKNFTGVAYLHMLVAADTTFNTSVGNVTFAAGARTKWHYHPGGQLLLVTSGKGRYQEQGKAVMELDKGDVVTCAPNVVHWHGAAPDSECTHLAIGSQTNKGAVVWLQPVTNEAYNNVRP